MVQILRNLFERTDGHFKNPDAAFKELHDTLCREYGRFRLSDDYNQGGDWGA
jgi:hypothetical protein